MSNNTVPSSLSVRGWAMVWLLFGWRIEGSIPGGAYLSVSLTFLAPLAVAWAVARFGPGLIAPLAAGEWMPSFGFRPGPSLWIGLAPVPLSFMLLGIACGAWLGARRHPAAWRALVHPSRTWLLVPALCLMLLRRFEWPPYTANPLGFGMTLDMVGGLVALLLVCIVDWNAVARQAPGGRVTRAHLLPVLLVVVASLRASVGIGMLNISWGLSWSGGSAAVIGVLCLMAGVPSQRRWFAAFALLLAAETLRLYVALPPLSHLLYEVRHPDSLYQMGSALCDLASAALLALVLSAFLARDLAHSNRRLWLALLAIVLLQFVAAPWADPFRTTFYSLNAAGWIAGGVAFAAALARGALGLVVAPLVMAAIVAAMRLLSKGIDAPTELLAEVCGVATVTAMYAFAGMLVRRSLQPLPGAAGPQGGGSLDIGRLAHFVHRLDTSATLRSFGALLVVLGAGAALAEFGVFAVLMQWFAGMDKVDGEDLVPALALFLLFALSPLAFIAFDAMLRQDRLRPLSVLSGAVLAGLGLSACAIWLGTTLLLPRIWPDSGATISDTATAATIAAAGLLLALMLVARARQVRIGIGALFVLTGTTGLVVLLALSLRDAGADPDAPARPAETAVVLLAVFAGVVLWVRGVWLRADLSSAVPRGLLLGEIGRGGFWARLACLMGMPASMWTAAALRTPAFWALLMSRPLVYLGIGGAWQGHLLAGGVAILAGHAAFEGGKRLAARTIWRVGGNDGAAPVLFLRSFEDDQFDLGGKRRNLWRRWLELWSFRRHLDEALVDEVARYGAVVALGRPGETRIPFGAIRHYSTHDDWRRVITETARRAHTIVVVAGDTPGVRWEYALLAREGLLDRTVLLFRPGRHEQEANRNSLAAFPLTDSQRASLGPGVDTPWIALLHLGGKPVLLTAHDPGPAAYVLALRTHFQQRDADTLAQAARWAPPRWSLKACFS